MSNKMYKNMKKQDEYYTAKEGVEPIVKYLKPNSIIWAPFDTKDSEYVKVLTEAGHTVIPTHIWNGQDFLNFTPDFNYDYIISNPPYSIKNEIIEKLEKIGKPYAMLIGVQALTIRGFMKRWRAGKGTRQLLLFENKIFFKNGAMEPTHYKKPGTYFHCYYFCNGWLPNDFIIEVLKNKNGVK